MLVPLVIQFIMGIASFHSTGGKYVVSMLMNWIIPWGSRPAFIVRSSVKSGGRSKCGR